VRLHRHPRVGNLFQQLFGFPDRADHAVRRGGEHQLSPIRQEQNAPFETHAFRHGEDQPVPARRGHPGEGDTGVAAGRLDDGRLAGRDEPPGFRIEDHGNADAILDRIAGRECLQFAHELPRGARREAVEPQERGVSDQLGGIVGDRGAFLANELRFGDVEDRHGYRLRGAIVYALGVEASRN
jgi:hypothetical protein